MRTFLAVAIIAVAGAMSQPAFAAGECGYYINSNGHHVPRPCGNWRNSSDPPAKATARCRDGTWSWSEHPHARGTCSHHGGVASYR